MLTSYVLGIKVYWQFWKNHIVAGFVVLYNLPNFLSKNKFVPLLARRGSELRCCEKLHVGQHWVLKEWNQTNGIPLLHNMSSKSNIRSAHSFFSVISCSLLIYIHLSPPSPTHPFTFANSKIGSGKTQILNTFTIFSANYKYK